MKVLYDHQIFTDQTFGGISRYFYELITFSKSNKLFDVDVSLKYSNNEYIKNYDLGHKTLFYENNFRGRKRVLRFFNKIHSNKILKGSDYDFFHPTYYDPYFLKAIGSRPFIITIYDMIHEKFANIYPELKDNTFLFKKELAEKSCQIIAISENTKKDIIEIFNIPEDKIAVTHLASSLKWNSSIEEINWKGDPEVLTNNFILFVGLRNLYKNFIFFTKSVAHLLLKYNLNLVCAGGGNFTSEEKKLFQDLKISGSVIHTKIDDTSLYNLYNKAELFVFPSVYEGFGIPILEAFSCGCPTALSNASCFPEVAQNAAMYFDPNNKESISSCIEQIISDRELRNNLREKGYQRVKDFSWEKTALNTFKIYKALL